MFKICVLGCGNMSISGHGPSFKKYAEDYKDTFLAACCDLDAKKAEEYKNKFGFAKFYTDYNEMLEKENPDVVSLICPVHLTMPLAVDIIKKGFNIILEKPPGLNSDETREILKAAEENNVFVRTAFNRRYSPLIRKLKEEIKDKQILNITYQMYRCQRTEPTFFTTAIHAIDATKNIVGADYKRIDFKYQEMPEVGENVANYYLDCEFTNGVRGQISLVPLGGCVCERVTVNTLGESYFVELPFWNNLDVPGRIRGIRKNEIIVDISGNELIDTNEMFEEMGFYEENREFFELIRSGAAPVCDLETGIQSVDVAACLKNREAFYSL